MIPRVCYTQLDKTLGSSLNSCVVWLKLLLFLLLSPVVLHPLGLYLQLNSRDTLCELGHLPQAFAEKAFCWLEFHGAMVWRMFRACIWLDSSLWGSYSCVWGFCLCCGGCDVRHNLGTVSSKLGQIAEEGWIGKKCCKACLYKEKYEKIEKIPRKKFYFFHPILSHSVQLFARYNLWQFPPLALKQI